MSLMKNLYRILAAAAALTLSASCIQEAGTEFTDDCVRRYELSFETLTRTDISGTGTSRKVSWSEGDIVNYYTKSGQSSPAEASVSLSGGKAFVTVPRGRADEFINVVYGATQLNSSSSTDNCIYIDSPVRSNQRYTSFAEAHVCAAFSDDIEEPTLRFRNAACIIRFTSAADVHKLVFSGNGGEIITAGSNGELKITCGSGGALAVEPASDGQTSVTVATDGEEADFYFAILPVRFSEGITVQCYDSYGELMFTKKTKASLNTVTEGGSLKMLNLGDAAEWIAENPSEPASVEAVDLGLPSGLKWASCNVGANSPEEYGDYFAWGETEPKTDYSWSTYKFEMGTDWHGPFSKYVTHSEIVNNFGNIDNRTVLDATDDAACVNWKGSWRMATLNEWEELIDKCTWTWTTQNGVKGGLVTGPNGNSIFLPAAGYRFDFYLSNAGASGRYWSSSLYTSIPDKASLVFLNYSGEFRRYQYNRNYGLSVRPVTE